MFENAYTRGKMRTLNTMGFFKNVFKRSKTIKIACKEKTVKILVMGKESTGKTSIIKKLCDQEEKAGKYVPTLYDVYEKCVLVDEYNVKMQFMDLGGSHVFPSMQEVFIKQADIFLLVYAIDDVESYSKMNELRDQITGIKQKHTTELPIIVVRNKIDLRNRRTKKEQQRRKSVNHWCYLSHDVSTKTGVKINAIMDNLIEESKFIGNEKDLGDTKVSGRYIYKGRNRDTSELYHKAPNMFKQHDNSDEKMDKRRRKSLHNQSRKERLTRSQSFGGFSTFRRKLSRRGPLPNTEQQEDCNVYTQDTFKTDLSQSVHKLSIDSDKSSVKSNSPTNSLIGWTSSMKSSVKKTSFDDDVVNDITTVGLPKALRNRRKSLSSNDLTGLVSSGSETRRNRSSSMNEEDQKKSSHRPRSISLISRDSPRKSKVNKYEIVHTTLKSDKNIETNDNKIPLLEKRLQGRTLRTERIRKLSSSLHALNDSENQLEIPRDHPLLQSRRQSRSQNDLMSSVNQFNTIRSRSQSTEDSVLDSFAMGKKKSIDTNQKKSILKTTIDENEVFPLKNGEGIDKKKRSVSFGKGDKKRPKISITKKFSTQSNASSVSFSSIVSSASTDRSTENLSRLSTPRSQRFRRRSLSSNDLTMIDEQDLSRCNSDISTKEKYHPVDHRNENKQASFLRSQSVATPPGRSMLQNPWIRSQSNEGLL